MFQLLTFGGRQTIVCIGRKERSVIQRFRDSEIQACRREYRRESDAERCRDAEMRGLTVQRVHREYMSAQIGALQANAQRAGRFCSNRFVCRRGRKIPTFSTRWRARLPDTHARPHLLARHLQCTAASCARFGRSVTGTALLHAARTQPGALLA